MITNPGLPDRGLDTHTASFHIPIMNLTGMRAVVFGGTSGIGLAVVDQLAAEGVDVLAASRTAADKTKPEGQASRHSVDVLNREDLSKFYEDHGPFDIMVNTAVPSSRAQGPFAEMTLDGFQSTFDKLWGYVNSVRLGLASLNTNASIVLVSGFPARKCLPGASAISTVGNAIEGFVRAIAPEISPRRINAVSPGIIDTPLFPQEGVEREEFLQQTTGTHSIPRPGTSAEVAQAVLFLLKNDFTTGTVVDVDGGATLP